MTFKSIMAKVSNHNTTHTHAHFQHNITHWQRVHLLITEGIVLGWLVRPLPDTLVLVTWGDYTMTYCNGWVRTTITGALTEAVYTMEHDTMCQDRGFRDHLPYSWHWINVSWWPTTSLHDVLPSTEQLIRLQPELQATSLCPHIDTSLHLMQRHTQGATG